MGIVTDAKIMRKGHKSRKFGFIGFKTDAEASDARKFFNNTYIDTSKMQVEFAKPQDDLTIERPWSKYSLGSSAYQLKHGKEPAKQGKLTDEEKQLQ
jgi:multiple RNA-binding domain-containing protein 1